MDGQDSNPARSGSPLRDPWVYAVAGLALILRLIYLTDLRHTPFFEDPQMDAWYHDQWARRLAEGEWWGGGVFFRAPLYPYFLGILYTLFGRDLLLVRVVQLSIGAVTAGLTTVLSYSRVGRVASITAGFLVALHGPLIYFEGELLLTVLEAPLFLFSSWILDRALQKGGDGPWLGAGAVLGLAALARPIILAVAPVTGLYLLLRRGRGGVRPILVGLGALLLVLSPVLLRNYLVGHDVVPVASQGGYNYYLGNNPASDGRAAVAPEFRRTWTGGLEDANRLAEAALGRSLKPSEVSRYWFDRALDWARDHPAAFLGLQLRKLAYFWDGFEIPNNQDPYFFSRLTRLFRTPFLSHFGVLGPLALAGLLVGLAYRRLSFAWVAIPLTLMAVIVAFFVCGRFRASLVPLLAVWAGAGFAFALESIRQRQVGRVTLYIAVLGVTASAANADLLHQRAQRSDAESHLRLGLYYASRGRGERARNHYQAAVRVEPMFADGWNNLGTLYAEQGDLDRARRAFSSALTAEPSHAKALSNLAALALQENRRAEADSLARLTLQVANREPEALYNAAVILGNLGDIETARAAFHELVALQPWNAAARIGEARALIALKDPEGARRVLLGQPEDRRTPELLDMLDRLGEP